MSRDFHRLMASFLTGTRADLCVGPRLKSARQLLHYYLNPFTGDFLQQEFREKL